MTIFDWDNWIKNELPIDAHLTQSSLTEDDHRLKVVWDRAFPEGLKHREWSQLIHLMYVMDGEKYPMSFRAVAHNVGVLLNLHYLYLLNEAYGTKNIQPDREILAWLKQRLQDCGYYEWLSEDDSQHIAAETLADLYRQLIKIRPCKRLILRRHPLAQFSKSDEQTTINEYLREILSLPSNWQGIQWREPNILIWWDEMMRVLQYNAKRTEQYMLQKEAHAFVGLITKLLNDHERAAREFTNLRANGIWFPVTQAGWQYWMVTINTSDIGVFGIEED